MAENPLRNLPGIDTLLSHNTAVLLVQSYGHDLTVQALRVALADIRTQLRSDGGAVPTNSTLIENAHGILESWVAPTLRRVINATGIIVHTNLGRAPLSDQAVEAVQVVAGGYATLEFDLTSGKRGSRSSHVEALLQRVTGAEAALVVNNNAAAVLLALTTLASQDGHNEVILSRGQLVEIGGGFRMPDVMEQSGARLVEIGATNRTHLADYESAIHEETVLILHVHRSNFTMVGFTGEPSVAELAELSHNHKLLLIDDIGSGALLDTSIYGLAPEPMVQASLADGSDLVLFSGDKLVGGPQAGILIGRAKVITRLRNHPLYRALRPDKLCLAALGATLTHYLKGDALEKIPVWQMISQSLSDLQERAGRYAEALTAAGFSCSVVMGHSAVGGGSLPGETLPTWPIQIEVPSAERALEVLRSQPIPVIARIANDKLMLDPRTILARDEEHLFTSLVNLHHEMRG